MFGFENPRDLIEAVAAGVDHERFLAGLQSVEQVLDIGHAGIDEDDIADDRPGRWRLKQ